MRLHPFATLALVVAALATAGATQTGRAPLEGLQTRAERSHFAETSRYDDVQRFLATVDEASDLVRVTSFGYTFEGRPLPLAVVGPMADATPAAVRASGLLRVYIQANIHAGEVEGKEAALALVRDIARGAHADWLRSMVLLVNPIYNADGNERVTLTSRGFQHGPVGGQGTRPNAQGLNINRDNMKLETPEARSMVRLLNDYDPHVMIDLHTTNGSRHAYHLTYETPSNPAVDGAVAREARVWLSEVARAVKASDGWDVRSYGNVSGQAPDRAWTTVEDLPRYTHNYWGLRNRFGILSETYSYLPFADRVATNRRFLEEVLGYAHRNAPRLRQVAEAADAAPLAGQRLSLRSKVTRGPEKVEILMGDVIEDVNPYSGRIMHRRADVRKPEPMWDETTFTSTETERVPSAYIVPATEKAVLDRLRAHGVRVEPMPAGGPQAVEEFRVSGSTVTERAFENHQERTVTGVWVPVTRDLAGAFRVPMTQPLARLAFYLLEPRSNDGLATWNVVDEAIKASRYPVLRTQDLAPISYRVRVPSPDTPYAHVEAVVPTGGRATVELMMPVWSPGYYRVEDHAARVDTVVALGPAGEPLAIEKTHSNRWRVTTGGAASIRLTYRLRCDQRTVTTNEVTKEYGVFNGAAAFITRVETARRPHVVQVDLPAGWTRVVTGLDVVPGDGAPRFRAADYETLVDSPILAGNLVVREFIVDGTPHYVVSAGHTAGWDGDAATKALDAYVQETRRFWGFLPYERYLFLLVFREGGGGLEHKNSTLCTVAARPGPGPWPSLGLLAHEHFHLYNAKRLRPVELGPFDFEKPPTTGTLWIAEGVTSYYSTLLMTRAGLRTETEYFGSLSSLIGNLENAPGRRLQSVEQSSLEVWNNSNSGVNPSATTVSYYNKGNVMGLLLDARIRRATAGRASLDDVMRLAYRRYSGERGYTADEFRQTAEEVAGVDLREWFRRAVSSTEDLDYDDLLEWFGLRFTTGEGSTGPWKLEPRPDATGEQRARVRAWLQP